MKFEQIKELINIISDSNLTKVEIHDNEFKIKLCKDTGVKEAKSVNYIEIPADKDKIQYEDKTEESDVIKVDKNIVTVTSPIVGTFYASPSPDDSSFVQVGSKVKTGDTLCIIEAMKLMNDITSEVNGEVIEIMVKNEDMVEYGQPIIKIKKD